MFEKQPNMADIVTCQKIQKQFTEQLIQMKKNFANENAFGDVSDKNVATNEDVLLIWEKMHFFFYFFDSRHQKSYLLINFQDKAVLKWN